MILFFILNLLAVFVIVFSWVKNRRNPRKTSSAIYILSIVPPAGIFAVIIYDQFFHAGGGVPGHQYLILLLAPVVLFVSICHIIYILDGLRKGNKKDKKETEKT